MGIKHMSRSTRGLVAVLSALLLMMITGVTAVQAVPAPVTWTVQVGSETPNLAIQGQRFLPGDVTINAGDKVTWVAKSAEIHTVTFLKGGTPQSTLPVFDPTDAQQTQPQGGSTFDKSPTSYFNSGVMSNETNAGPLPFPAVHSYSLTFPDAGTYTYYCSVHGVMMVGVVHVQAAGSPYPYTQAQYDEQARLAKTGIRVDGQRLHARLLSQATQHKVFTGGDDGLAMLMRFVRPKVLVHVGQSVRFVNNGMGAPHTVTFGTEPANIFAPVGDPTKYKGGDLSSGIIPPGGKFKVTFKKAGTFHYICALHDEMGMVGQVVVRR